MGLVRSVTMVVLVLVVAVGLAGAQENACASKLVDCAPYLNWTTTPPANCCNPIKETVTHDLACLCNLYNTPGFLASLGLDITQALRLSQNCGVPVAESSCNGTAPSPHSQPPPPPGVPGGGDNGAQMLVWTGISPLLLLLLVSMVF